MSCRLLLAFDSPGHLRAVRALLDGHAEVRVARCAKSAAALLEAMSFDGAIVSARLSGASRETSALLATARARIGPDAPLLLVGGSDREMEEELRVCSARGTKLPLGVEEVSALLARLTGRALPTAPEQTTLRAIIAILCDVRERAGLTPTEIDVLAAAVFGETRDDLRERLVLRDATLRKHVSTILRKVAGLGFEAETLDRLVAMLYMRATLGSGPGERAPQSAGLPGPSESMRTRTSVEGRDGFAGR